MPDFEPSGSEPRAEYTDWQLTSVARRLYSTGPELGWHARLTTVYRPLYAPFGLLLHWIPAGATMLDLGCGTGAFLLVAHALKPLARGYGLDINAAALRIAQQTNRDPRVRFLEGHGAPAEIIRECDVITLIDLFHHVPKGEKLPLLQHLFDHARPGTIIVLKDLDTRPRWRAFANRVTDYLSTRSLVDYMALGEVEAFFRRNGLHVLYARQWPKQVWTHYLVVGRR